MGFVNVETGEKFPTAMAVDRAYGDGLPNPRHNVMNASNVLASAIREGSAIEDFAVTAYGHRWVKTDDLERLGGLDEIRRYVSGSLTSEGDEKGEGISARRSVRCLDTGEVFATASDAARSIMPNLSSDEAAKKGYVICKSAMHRGSSLGRRWELADGSSVDLVKRDRSTWASNSGRKGSSVRCIDLDRTFKTMREAGAFISPDNPRSGASMVSDSIRLGRKAGGYRWEKVG